MNNSLLNFILTLIDDESQWTDELDDLKWI